MPDDLRIRVEAQVDVASSAKAIEGQLPELSKKINGRIQLGAEINENDVVAQVKSVAAKAKTVSGAVNIPVGISVQADTLKRLLDQQVKTLKKRAEKIEAPLDFSKFDAEYAKNSLEGFRQASKELRILRAETTSWGAGLAKLIPMNPAESLSKNIANAAVETDKLRLKFEGLRGGVPKEAISGFEKLAKLQGEMVSLPSDDIEGKSKKYNEFASTIGKLTTGYDALLVQQKRADQGVSFDITEKRAQKLILTVENLKTKYSSFLNDRGLVAQYNQLFDAAKAAKSAKEISNVNAQIGKFEQTLESAGKRQRSFTDELSNNIKKMGSWMILGGLMASLIRDVKQVFTNVVAINSAMTEVKKVTEETDKAYNNFLKRAADNAVKLGASMTDLINSTADFARLGFNLEQAETLGQVANIYYRVADGLNNIGEASSSIISTMKAYGIESNNAISIADKFNEVGNRFAITSGGIGSALTRSAAALAEANNTLDESIALNVAANNVIQDPDVVGTMWKTVAMRIRGAKVELEDAGLETDGMVESTSKLREQVSALTNGFDIMVDENTFKSTYEIIKGIGKIYGQLSDINQASLLELLAGKRQGNALAAAFSNITDMESALKVSQESSGSAMKEHAKWMDSVAAKQEQLTAQFQAFSATILSSDLIKGTYETGTGILGFLTQATEQLGALPVLATAAAGVLSAKLPSLFTVGSNGISLSDSAKGMFAKQSPYSMLADADANKIFDNFAKATQSGAVALRDFNIQTKDAGIKAYLSTVQNGVGTLDDYQRYVGSANQALAQMSLKSKIAAVGMKALSIATSMAISMGISLLINAVVTGISNLANAQENAIEKANQLSKAWKDNSNKLSNTKKTLSDIQDEYAKLSKGVDMFGNNVSLSTEEYTKYNEIVNKIADMFPDMVQGYTEEGNAILKTKGRVEELTQAYKDAEKAANDTIIRQSADVFSGVNAASGKGGGLFKGAFSDIGSKILAGKNLLDAILAGDKNLVSSYSRLDGYSGVIKELGLDDSSIETLMQNGKTVESYIRSLTSELNSYASQVIPIINAYLSQDNTYINSSKATKDVISSIISSFDYEFYKQFNGSVPRLMAWFTTNVTEALTNSGLESEISNMLTLQGDFKQSKIPIESYESALNGFSSRIKNLAPEVQIALANMFNPDISTMKANVAEKIKGTEEDWKTSLLTLEDLSIAVNLSVSDVTFDGLKEAIDAKKKQVAEEVSSSFEDIQKSFGNQLDRIDYEKSRTQSIIDLKQKNGVSILAEDYDNAIAASSKRVFALIDERSKLAASLNKSLADGSIKEGSDEWNKQREAIEKTNTAIDDENQLIGELSRKIAEIPLENLNLRQGSLDSTKSLLESSLSLKEASGAKILASDYQALSKNAEEMIVVKNGMRDFYIEQMKGLSNTSPLYNEYLSKLTAILAEINNLRAAQLEWTNSAEQLGVSGIESSIERVKNEQQSVKNDISLLEAQGGTASSGQYEYLIQKSNELISLYEEMNVEYAKQIEIADKTSKKYEETTKKIEENKQAISDAKVQQEEWKKEVTKTLTAYDKWLKAKDSKESGDTYRGISDAIKEVNELIKDGETGTLKYKAGLELLVPDSAKTSLKTVKDYLASIKGYFTEGPDGARKFAADLAKNAPDLAKYNVKTGDLSLYTRDISKIAAAMNMTEEAAYSMIGRLNELVTNGPGFTVEPPKVKEADLKYNDLATPQIDTLNAKPLKDKTATLTYKVAGLLGGISSFFGFAKGTKGAPKGPAFVGEGEGDLKGPELIYNKKKRLWRLVTKPTLTNLDEGEVVYNAKQTKQMMNGNIGALKGNAYAFGTNNQQTDSGTGGPSGGSGNTGTNDNTKPKKRSDPFAAFQKSLDKLYDWFERAIEVTDRLVNRLKNAANLEVGYKNKNKVLDQASKVTKDEIKTARKQEEEYTKKAEQVAAQSGLSPDMIKKIQDGSLDMESLDDKTKKKVEAYKEWWDKAEAVKDKLIELREQEKELAKQKIDNIIEDYGNQIGKVESASNLAQSNIDKKKAQGQKVTAADYAPLIQAEQKKAALLAKERAAIQAELAKQMAAGNIEEGSDAWYEYQQQLADIDMAANDAAIAIEGFNDSIDAIAVDNLKAVLTTLQQVQTELEGAISLAEAQGGSGTADQYNALIGNTNQQIANMESQNDLLEDQLDGLDPLCEEYQTIQSQIDANTNAINDAKIAQEGWNDAIVDIEIDAIQDQIDSLNEVNDQLQRQYELQDKLEAVEKARQRTRLVYKEGVGFVRMADEKAIRDAERALAQTQHQETIAQLQHQIDLLEDIKTNTNLYNPDGTPVTPPSTTTTRGLIPLSVDGVTQVNSRGMSSVASLVNGTNFANQMASIITAGLSGITSNSAFMNTDKPQINVKVEINNPNFNEVSGVGEFARTITATLAPALQQEISKYK